MARYHSLLARDSKAENWSIQFGDFDKECVIQEAEDQKDSGTFKYFKIITTGVSQKDIDAAVAKLNARPGEVVN